MGSFRLKKVTYFSEYTESSDDPKMQNWSSKNGHDKKVAKSKKECSRALNKQRLQFIINRLEPDPK
ncbi:hypothetical protein HQ34_09465 [Porphyromonas cangingivalis]|nr:hypothetical protein HQ34_09465 [Porphyromonas cangingivalis]